MLGGPWDFISGLLTKAKHILEPSLWSWPMKWSEAWEESLIQAQIELHSKGSSIHHSPLKEAAAPGMDLTN